MTEGLSGAHAELLQRVDLFAALDRMALAQVAAFVEAVTIPEGGVVFRQGEPGDALYIVVQGKFGVSVSLPDTGTEVRLTTLSPGDAFGEMALLTDEPRSATVRNEGAPGEVLRLERSRFFELIRREPTLVNSIAAQLTRRLQANARLILQSEHFIVSVVDHALARVDPARRRQILESSVLDEVTPEALRALFGPDADEVALHLAEAGIVRGPSAGPVLRVLRERFERAHPEDWQHFAREAAARLADAGLWSAALPLYVRHAPREAFVEVIGRALRHSGGAPSVEIAPWLDRVEDEEAAHDAEIALAKAALYEERGTPDAALGVLQRAYGAALSHQNTPDARRLSEEVARLSMTSGAEPMAALHYGLRPSRVRRVFRPGARVVMVAAAVALAGAAILTAPGPVWKFSLLLGAAIVLWVSDVLPMGAVSLFLLASWITTGLARPEQATAGFGSRDWLFVLALLGIAAAIARSGLLFRVGLLLIRRMPQGLLWQAGTLLLTGILLGPFLPMAMGRAALTAPLALGVAQALRLRDREPAAATLGLSAWIGAGPMLFTFLNASPACLLAWGLLPVASRQRFDWIHWFLAAAPLTLLLTLASLGLLFLILRPQTKTALSRDRLALQLAVLGPPSRRERAMAAVLLFTLGGWLLGPRLGVDTGTVALIGLLAAFVTGNLDRQSFRELDWNYLIFYGVALSLGGMMGSLGINRALGDAIASTLGQLGVTPVLFVLLVGVLGIVLHMLIGEQAVLLLALTFIPVAPAVGVDPWIVVIAILTSVVTWIVPATTPEYLVAYSASEGRLYSHPQAIRVAVAYAVMILVALVLIMPYWRLLGLL
ncbi:MAG: SLC13 family permease [bacterium]